MALLSLQNIRMAFGGQPLLDGVTLQIEPGERICLLGRNGTGKSTLLKVVTGDLKPDAGDVVQASTLRTARLAQDIPAETAGTVFDVVASDWNHEHELDHPVEKVISLLRLDPQQPFASLSGGMRRRTLLAKALINEPELLVLDEPTNHLDIESIQWLENFLLRWKGTLLFVTHDRVFLQKLATRIIELDRGRLTSWDCDYPKYLERRQALLDAEEGQWAEFDRKLAQEEVWIRKGIKARRTRNEGRVRALEAMRLERCQRRERTGTVKMQLINSGRTGQRVITAKNVSCGYGADDVIRDFSVEIQRGDRVGIIGPNGCGKSTLLNVLLGRLAPRAGEIVHGTHIEAVCFDQHRAALDDSRNLIWNLCGDNDFLAINGNRVHALSYLRNFLFTPAEAVKPVGLLSGGERNRLMLAKIFAQPSNVLELDEPTNDLDMETLDLLEEQLADYQGTVLLVSHDRALLNHTVTRTLVFEGDGRIGEYAGGYDDWVQQSGGPRKLVKVESRQPEPASQPGRTARKLSNREREELENLPGVIEALETELEGLHQTLNDPGLYRRPPAEIKTAIERSEIIPRELEAAYARWAALEEKQNR
ncbi:MAG: ATP-binding cassette domain-containing protein [Kiritimatiellia bacterium]